MPNGRKNSRRKSLPWRARRAPKPPSPAATGTITLPVCTAARAAVHTGSVIVPVAAGEGGFGALLARHGKLFRREFFLPFGIGLDDFVHLDALPSLPIIAE